MAVENEKKKLIDIDGLSVFKGLIEDNTIKIDEEDTSFDIETDEEIKKSEIVDNLLSTSATQPLSANQGRILNEKIEEIDTKQIDVFSIEKNGLVPKPGTDDDGKFLRSDGTWVLQDTSYGDTVELSEDSTSTSKTATHTITVTKSDGTEQEASWTDVELEENDDGSTTLNCGENSVDIPSKESVDKKIELPDDRDGQKALFGDGTWKIVSNSKDHELYGFTLDLTNNSDPSTCITYLDDCDNTFYQNAYMDYTADKFNYGDWGNAFFIRNCRPCILNLDGSVYKYLDKNDYSKDIDGNSVEIGTSCVGNVMVEIPTVWLKFVDYDVNKVTVYVSDKQIDSDYKAFAHTNINGVVKNAIYISPYLGYNVSSTLRSFSGVAETTNISAINSITYAKNNYPTDDRWSMFQYADWCLITLLLTLIGKSTDTQTIFGQGNTNSYVSDSNKGIIKSGTMNSKGLFYGTNSATDKVGVKVFGIENYWGNLWSGLLGWINDKGTQKVKLTYGKQDGSTIIGYNDTGSGYRTISNATPSGTNGGYISQMMFDSYGDIVPKTASGSSSTYYADGLWFNNTQVNFADVGGHSFNGLICGAFSSALDTAPSLSLWDLGARLSCKPV